MIGLFIISWFLVGLLTFLFVCIFDMKDKEFDENYFKFEDIGVYLIVICVGYVSALILLCVYIFDILKEKRFEEKVARWIYDLANPDKKDEE